jgi:hypothetical protein
LDEYIEEKSSWRESISIEKGVKPYRKDHKEEVNKDENRKNYL